MKEHKMVIYEPDPPMGNPGKQKTILDYPELIEFIKQVDVAIDKRGKEKLWNNF